MYKIDINNKELIKLIEENFFGFDSIRKDDIKAWISEAPDMLDEELLIIGKYLILSTGKTLDVLAIDKNKSSVATLNLSYTFENFIVETSNQLAFDAAKSVVNMPGKLYNPLFIHGSSGLGKTHLLHAIGNDAIQKGARVIYTTAEEFMNDFLNNLRNSTANRFRAKYRECDYLLIDDIQFFSGKEQTQKELLLTFDALHRLDKQIILTSDKPPKEILGLENRLRSRFEWGIIIDIQPPEVETKISIIQKKCELDGVVLQDDIVQYIATNIGDDIRKIESAITTINSFAQMKNQAITLEFAKDAIKDLVHGTS